MNNKNEWVDPIDISIDVNSDSDEPPALKRGGELVIYK